MSAGRFVALVREVAGKGVGEQPYGCSEPKPDGPDGERVQQGRGVGDGYQAGEHRGGGSSYREVGPVPSRWTGGPHAVCWRAGLGRAPGDRGSRLRFLLMTRVTGARE